MALLYQLISDISKDCEHAKQDYSHIAGEEVVAAALNLGHVFRSKQPAFSFDIGKSVQHTKDNSNLPKHTKVLPQQARATSTLPQLPIILDPSMAETPFIHSSILKTEFSKSPNASYDRLEFIGDAYIELIATRLIYDLFPNLPAGRMSQVRESLVKNETLAEFSSAYRFDERTRLTKTFDEAKAKGNKAWKKFLGDIFEAYVAAYILSDPLNGFATAEKWLTELWSPKLQKVDSPPETRAKDDLARKLMGKSTKLDYRDEAPPEMIRSEGKVWYTIGVYFTGWGWERQYLGSGRGLSRTQAGTRAAEQALLNPISDKISDVKKEFDAKVKLERQQQLEKEEFRAREPEH